MYAVVRQLLLKPLSYLYAAGVGLRNAAYNSGILEARAYNTPLICVGNVLVGGTGKTPMIAYLAGVLSNYRIGIVSRGYGRKSRGLLIADENATAETIGDEPMQLYKAFNGRVKVAVCADRRKAIEALEGSVDVIIMDDGMQHRRVKPGLLITLFTAGMVKVPQHMLPYGRLRDTFGSAKRANLMVITKSNCASAGEKEKLAEQVGALRPVFKSFIKYSSHLIGVFAGTEMPLADLRQRRAIVFTGIAHGADATHEIAKYAQEVQHLEFGDHHTYTPADVALITGAFNSVGAQAIIITTEKDAVRLHAPHLKHVFLGLPLYYLPITTEMCSNDKADFDNEIKAYVKRATGNC